MRVSMIVFGDLDQPSGGYLYDQHLARALRGAGHEVSVVSQPTGLSYRNQVRLGRDTRRAITRRRRGDARHAHPDLGTLSRLVQSRPDLVVVDELNHAAVAPWLRDVRRVIPDVPVVGLVHHLRSDEGGVHRLSRRRERRSLRGCDAWLCNSTVTMRRVQRVSGVRRSSAVAFPGGDASGYGHGTGDVPAVHPVKATTAPGRPAPLRVLAVGSLIPRKNLHVLLRAAAAVPAVELSIVGDRRVAPRYAESLARLIERHRMADRVALRGRVPSDMLEAEFRAAHLFAVPSRYEGFGIVYLEAMSRGVPVIASRAGGARDIVRHGRDGFLVPPGSVRAVRQTLERLAADRGTLAHLGTAARQRAAGFHTWERSMAGAVRFLESIIGAGTRTSRSE